MSPDARTLECLRALIGFDTVSRNSNLDCLDWARARLEANGARIRLDWNADRTKANLFATFGEGPGGTVLSGHTDVVSVDGQPWSSDPFTMRIAEGRAYGRGACDMKGFDAVVLAHCEDYAKADLKAPIHVALTYDEELGCLGIPHLIADLDRAGIKPDGCVVGEPTSMRMVRAHKGGRVYRCKVTGKAAHSSLTPSAVNAIEYAARIVALIGDLGEREKSGLRVEGFDVPHTTISTNLISGGNGPNIVPAEAEFLFDFRYVPGFDPDAFFGLIRDFARNELEPRMRAIDPASGIALSLVNAIPALDAKDEDAIFKTVLGIVEDKTIEKVGYGTEASFFEAYGVPSVVCGPGSIVQAHKADEYVALDQLAACDRFVERLVASLSKGGAAS